MIPVHTWVDTQIVLVVILLNRYNLRIFWWSYISWLIRTA